MAEKPILFSGAMVKAILAGTKSQTRRILTHKHVRNSRRKVSAADLADVGACRPTPCGALGMFLAAWPGVSIGEPVSPYGVPGDRLWVRETFSHGPVFNADVDTETRLRFQANELDSPLPPGQKWRPSIFMPRWASRITLEITDVRVQRLQEISEEDIRAEGVTWNDLLPAPGLGHARQAWASLWDSINGDRAPWASNPWVWAISFRREEPRS